MSQPSLFEFNTIALGAHVKFSLASDLINVLLLLSYNLSVKSPEVFFHGCFKYYLSNSFVSWIIINLKYLVTWAINICITILYTCKQSMCMNTFILKIQEFHASY